MATNMLNVLLQCFEDVAVNFTNIKSRMWKEPMPFAQNMRAGFWMIGPISLLFLQPVDISFLGTDRTWGFLRRLWIIGTAWALSCEPRLTKKIKEFSSVVWSQFRTKPPKISITLGDSIAFFDLWINCLWWRASKNSWALKGHAGEL